MKNLFTFFCAFIYCSFLYSQIHVNQDASGSNDGTSWENAFTDLQAAIDSANEGDQIWLAQGTYAPVGPAPDSSNFLVNIPIQLYGGFAGNESSLDQRDWESNVTLISGDINEDDIPGNINTNRSDNAFHVLTINATAGTTIIDGFHFQGGMTRTDDPVSGESFVPWRGGAMYISSSAEIANCIFEDNFGNQGAAIYAGALDPVNKFLRIENSIFRANVENSNGAASLSYFERVEVVGCSFENNLAGSYGGGLVMGNLGGLIDQCSFEGNNAIVGGGLFLWQNSSTVFDSSRIEVRRSYFSGNVGSGGGGIRINNFHGPTFYEVDSCEFNNNIATSEGGGIVMYSNSSTGAPAKTNLQIKNSSFADNMATGGGGAISCYPRSDTIILSVENSSFVKNSGAYGGAVLGYNSFSGSYLKASVKQCIFMENQASGDGGGIGIYHYSLPYNLQYEIDNCSFISNSGFNYGGALSTSSYGGNVFRGAVTNSSFQNNDSPGTGGAISSTGEELHIESCDFIANNTEGTFQGYEGGGALSLDYCPSVDIMNSSFVDNNSDADGSAILNVQCDRVHAEGVLFQNNTGSSLIGNNGHLELVNVTLHGNDNGILMKESSSLFIQNSILHNINDNLISAGEFEVVSGGANISNDVTTTPFLIGNSNYSDIHELDHMLNDQLVPIEGSPCVDRGNPDGVTLSTDLNGEDRVQGQQIDIGCYESPFITSSRHIVWENSALQVYPNPVNDLMNLNINNIEVGQWQIQVYNFEGRLISKNSFFNPGGSYTYQAYTHTLNAGEYYVIVNRDEQVFGSKFLKVNN